MLMIFTSLILLVNIQLLMENFLKLATLWLLIHAINNSVTNMRSSFWLSEIWNLLHPYRQASSRDKFTMTIF
ncbi:hypothetical protein HN51_047246, partial [Arachis hypogaea]